jgi:tetratricopeptide (TPR) repeat protein
LGSLYLDLGESKKGIDLLQRGLQASQIEPMVRYELHFNLAYAFSQRGDYKRAEKQFQAAVEQPISAYLKLGTYNNWGNMRMRQKNPVAAQVLFQKVVEIDPNFALGFYNLATALKATGNLNGAVLCYQRAIELDPTDAESHQGLGVTYLKGGRVVEGLDSLRRAIALYQQQGSPEAERLQQVLTEMHLA